MAVLLPCALLAAAGVQVLLSASVLVAWELCDSLNLIWTQVRPCSGDGGWWQQGRAVWPASSSWLPAPPRALARAQPPGATPRLPIRMFAAAPPLPQLSMLVLNGVQPNELVVKRLAMLGCTGARALLASAAMGPGSAGGGGGACHGAALGYPLLTHATPLATPLPRPLRAALVLAHSMREQRVAVSSYAGLLLSGDGGRQRQPGRAKSAMLLAGRLLTALLFVYVGVTQASWLLGLQG